MQDKNNGIIVALAVHILQTGHKIKCEDVMVTHREQQWTKRKVKEGLSIKTKPNNMNLDTGTMIDPNQNLNC